MIAKKDKTPYYNGESIRRLNEVREEVASISTNIKNLKETQQKDIENMQMKIVNTEDNFKSLTKAVNALRLLFNNRNWQYLKALAAIKSECDMAIIKEAYKTKIRFIIIAILAFLGSIAGSQIPFKLLWELIPK